MQDAAWYVIVLDVLSSTVPYPLIQVILSIVYLFFLLILLKTPPIILAKQAF